MMTTTTAANNLFISCFVFIFFPKISAAISLITQRQYLTTQQTLISAAGEFELGFFTKSDRWYVGVWYKNVEPRTIIWVANRDSPLSSSSSNLTITAGGNLALVNESGNSVWFSNFSTTGDETVAELLDNGNFIVRYANDYSYIWQSFDYPTDTLMPGMKLGWNLNSGLNRFITSWKDSNDPSLGDYTFKLESHGYPEAYLRNKERINYRSGPWNGQKFAGEPEMIPNHVVFFNFTVTPNEVTYSYNLFNQSIYSRLMLNEFGTLQRLTWVPSSKIWSLYWYAPKDQCDDYGECGPNGICDVNSSPVCKCLNGFVPKNPQSWSLRDGSQGCVLYGQFDCKTDGFLLVNNVKLPASAAATVDYEIRSDQCREVCQRNCSCRAFTDANVTNGGSGCVFWAEDLYDMRQFAATEGAQNIYLYLRQPASALEENQPSSSKKKSETLKIVAITIIPVFFVLVLTSFVLWKKLNKEKDLPQIGTREKSQELLLTTRENFIEDDISKDELDLPLYDLNTLLLATNEFSDSNKLGKGGFGVVYKGILEDGREIAVKRLSKTSVQGNEEFRNEVKMIARLQHRNLVRLLGCCIEMEEKMLIYEYMENKSLDSVLFQKERSSILDWSSRFNIICGISRGLLYLHQDSRFRIIHRDLKASNVLLDKEMNPKISDFGMARIFGGDQTEAETIRVVGTYGYMSPEYAMGGIFSIKSDVFSFGILVLEIVCGIKNRTFSQTNDQLHLPAYAWKLHTEGRGLELLDQKIGDLRYSAKEVLRCISVALLCVQEQPEDRPNMSNVVVMLSSDDVPIPKMKFPGYCLDKDNDHVPMSKHDDSFSVNQISVTVLRGR